MNAVEKLGGRSCALIGAPDAPSVLLQPVDAGELTRTEEEFGHIRRLAPETPFLLAAFPVGDWNGDLSPWPAPPVFGDAAFGGGAARTLDFVERALIPALEARCPAAGERRWLLGGYSLAGLFALWAACESGRFAGAAGVSPSVWFPGWLDYAAAHPLRAGWAYLSLGDREERARNPVMARVGDAVRATHGLWSDRVDCALEWNPGNHFREPELRTAKGFAWLLRSVR